jgi:hypothetical protein
VLPAVSLQGPSTFGVIGSQLNSPPIVEFGFHLAGAGCSPLL